MSNLLFPKVRGLGWTITKNPTFSTEIQSSLAGREVRVQKLPESYLGVHPGL